MSDISLFFQPIDLNNTSKEESLGSVIIYHGDQSFPELDKEGVAIIHVPEYRNAEKQPINNDFFFREALSQLFKGQNWNQTIYDLGTILPGHTIADTYHAIKTVCATLMKKNILPIIIGGSQDLTFALYKSYEELEQLVNITNIDCSYDFGISEEKITSNGWIYKIITEKPCYLFNHSNIASQGHYLSVKEQHLFEDLYFDAYRLGAISENITLAEPVLRNTDLCTFDINAIRSSELDGSFYQNPNGLFNNEACRILRYAGISDKISSVIIANYYCDNMSAADHALIAQLIWYTIDGYMNRKGDFPKGSKKSYLNYKVQLLELNEEINFYKSNKSDRWWMEVPYPSNANSKYNRHHLVPCTYEDYQEAMKGELPSLWWKTYQKLV